MFLCCVSSQLDVIRWGGCSHMDWSCKSLLTISPPHLDLIWWVLGLGIRMDWSCECPPFAIQEYSPTVCKGTLWFTSPWVHDTTSALQPSLPIVFRPADHFRSLLTWKHCGSSSTALPTFVRSHPTISSFTFIIIFIMAWWDHAICHHISHRTTLYFNYYFIVRVYHL